MYAGWLEGVRHMGLSAGLRHRLVEDPSSIGERKRQRRWALLQRLFPDISEMSVLDLGGTVDSWRRAPLTPRHVTVLNLASEAPMAHDRIEPVTGDACNPPDSVRRRSYDLVYSNSLLEHVGGHARRTDLAEVVHAAAPAHWVQTPHRYFPLEPHWLFPGLQFFPTRIRAEILRVWPLKHARGMTRDEALKAVLWIELVSRVEMSYLFPTSVLVSERIGPLTKSLIAVAGSSVLVDDRPEAWDATVDSLIAARYR